MTRPTRPTKPHHPPIFYKLPAWLLTAGMTAAVDGGGYDVCPDPRLVGGQVVYELSGDGGELISRSTPVRWLVDLAVFWDTAVDGSVLPEAVDVRTR